MKISEMNKEQKQVAALAGMGVLTVFFVTLNLFYKPAMARRADVEKQYEAIQSKLKGAQRILARDVNEQKRLQSAAKTIMRIKDESLPPDRSTFAWVLSRIDRLGERFGLTVAIDMKQRPRYIPLPPGGLDAKARRSLPVWIPYTVTVSTSCTFDEAARFVTAIQETHPYASVTNLRISQKKRTPETHLCTFDLEWLTFRSEADANTLRTYAGGTS